MEKIIMPAGQYYIGDLCYVLGDKWDEVCGLTICGNECHEGKFTLSNGVDFVMFGTAYGDGCYPCSLWMIKIGVDSGTIGCIETKYIDQEKLESCKDYSLIWNFDTDFECYNEFGNMTFGSVEIMTEDDPFAEDQYEEEDDPDEEGFDVDL